MNPLRRLLGSEPVADPELQRLEREHVAALRHAARALAERERIRKAIAATVRAVQQ